MKIVERAKYPGVAMCDRYAAARRFARAVQLSPLQLRETYPHVTRLLHALATPHQRRSVQARGVRPSPPHTARA